MTDDTHPGCLDEEILTPVDERLVAAQAACVDHAADLIESAKALVVAGKANIAYHLATLASEELGRRELLGVEEVARRARAEAGWPRKAAIDHVQKLFFFKRTHEKTEELDRLAGLVATMAKRPPVPPTITLSDVALLKLLCDTYFLAAVIPHWQGKSTLGKPP